MEFIQILLSEVVDGEHSLDVAAGKAYSKSLRKHHNWIVRGVFNVSVSVQWLFGKGSSYERTLHYMTVSKVIDWVQ